MVDIEDGHHQLCALCSPGVLTSPYPWRFFTNPAFFQLPGDCIPHSSVCILLSQDTAPPPTGPPCRASNSELLPHPAPNLALPRSLSEAPCPKPHSSLVWNLLSSLAWWKVLLSHCSPNTQSPGPGCPSVLLAANTLRFLSLDTSGLPADPHTCHRAFARTVPSARNGPSTLPCTPAVLSVSQRCWDFSRAASPALQADGVLPDLQAQ